MSRSGYCDDCDDDYLAIGRWRAMVKSAIRGRRGQKFLRDTIAALDAMPEKRLIAEELRDDGEVCTLGAVLIARGADPDGFDPEEHGLLAKELDIAPCLVQEVEYENDEGAWRETPEQRWQRMRKWVEGKLAKERQP